MSGHVPYAFQGITPKSLAGFQAGKPEVQRVNSKRGYLNSEGIQSKPFEHSWFLKDALIYSKEEIRQHFQFGREMDGK